MPSCGHVRSGCAKCRASCQCHSQSPFAASLLHTCCTRRSSRRSSWAVRSRASTGGSSRSGQSAAKRSGVGESTAAPLLATPFRRLSSDGLAEGASSPAFDGLSLVVLAPEAAPRVSGSGGGGEVLSVDVTSGTFHTRCRVSANKLGGKPTGCAFDARGNLWVAVRRGVCQYVWPSTNGESVSRCCPGYALGYRSSMWPPLCVHEVAACGSYLCG